MTKILGYFKKKGHNLLDTVINEPKKIAVIVVGFNALFQLAVSQIHIESLVKVKLTNNTLGTSNYTTGMASTGIGMFFFMFILFGLATIFNITRASDTKRVVVGILSVFGTMFFGLIYYLKATNPDSLTQFADVAPSVNLMILGFILYAVTAGFMIYELFRHKKA